MNTATEAAVLNADQGIRRPIVVGFDGSAKNRSAVDWAVNEAQRTGRELVVVTAGSSMYARPVPFFAAHFDVSAYDNYATDTSKKLVAELQRTHPGLRVRPVVQPREAVSLILDASVGADLTVVGKRGLGTFKRIMVGSTSIAVAGRSQAPTVVVPERWNLRSQPSRRPIVLGLDLEEHDDHCLDFAFQRAADLEVRLIVVYAWETHPDFLLGETDRLSWEEAALREMHQALRPWEEKYPTVDVEVMQRNDNPALCLLEKAAPSQLLVLGRRTAPDRMGGFAFGSVARAVLHYSTTPVAIVPEQPTH